MLGIPIQERRESTNFDFSGFFLDNRSTMTTKEIASFLAASITFGHI
jgi:hypothetical protein